MVRDLFPSVCAIAVVFIEPAVAPALKFECAILASASDSAPARFTLIPFSSRGVAPWRISFHFVPFAIPHRQAIPPTFSHSRTTRFPTNLREEYYRASAYNFVRLIKAKPEPDDNDSNNVYTRAASSLSDWLDGSFLAQEDAPSFYPYFQEFPHPDTGETFVRKALSA